MEADTEIEQLLAKLQLAHERGRIKVAFYAAAEQRICAKIGGILRDLRESRGIATRAVAREMGVTRSYINSLETGQRTWTPDLVSRFNAALRAKAN